MKLLRLCAAIALACLLSLQAALALSETSPNKIDFDWVFSSVTQGVPERGFVLAQAPPAAPPAVTQNTVSTTGPVTSDTTISVGTLAGEFLKWIASAFSLVIGTVLTLWLKRLFTLAGVQVTQQMSDQLDKTLVNGLNDAATRSAQMLQGKGKIEINNAIVAGAVAYAQDHRAETIQALGLDPQSGKAVEALKARIATLANDPSVPTPAGLTTPAAVAAPQAAVK